MQHNGTDDSFVDLAKKVLVKLKALEICQVYVFVRDA